MVRRTAPTKSTGGGGFSFADKVAAFFLAQMLRGGLPLGEDAGPIAELHFETKESGWVFDDLLLVLKNREEISSCALSVKSDPKLTREGFERGFVQDAWEQWHGVAGSTFNPEKDFLGLATVPVAISVRRAWDALGREASSAPPVRLARRLTPNFQASSLKRRVFESLRNARATPDGKKPTAPETAKLLARIRLFHFDFESAQSGDEERAIALCSEIARSGTLDRGRDLWGRLIGLAAEARTTGGYFDIPKLVRSLRGAIELNDYPDHRGDWRAIEERASANRAEVRTVVGEDIHLERNKEENMIANALQGATCVAVVGESGSGKSAVVATLVRPGHAFDSIECEGVPRAYRAI